MKAKLKAYAHIDNYEDMEPMWDTLSTKAKAEYNNDMANFLDKVGRPFSEIELVCTLDTKTHEVIVDEVNLGWN